MSSAKDASHADHLIRCDRAMRKTVEALQAWRRAHGGQYPDRLADLKLAGLVNEDGAICPGALEEEEGADASHGKITSRGPGGDPDGAYEYELAPIPSESKVRQNGFVESVSYTRKELKEELLRRPFAEQMPLLRCSSHREKSGRYLDDGHTRRNITYTGQTYWSGEYWELSWLNDVPYCCRDRNILFGLQGPPFHTARAPTLAGAVDLRTWTCAFGDSPWWWASPTFSEDGQVQAATLEAFFQWNHGRVAVISGESWWLDGLVQLQGKISPHEEDVYRAPRMEAFVWQRTSLPIHRRMSKAAWLQGTVWEGRKGETAGQLIWRYVDGSSEKTPIIYGITTARFWTDARQKSQERDFPEPVWSAEETKAEVGIDRTIRVYRQEWSNPHPDREVATLDFVSDPACYASPFLLSLNIEP